MMTDARLAIARLNLSDCLVTPQSTDLFLQCLKSYAAMTDEQGATAQTRAFASVEKAYGIEAPKERTKPFIFNDGVAVIPVHGVLVNRFGGCWGFVTGYNFIRAQMNAANADPEVELIVFDHNTPGGDAAGCFELTAEMRELATPTLAVVDDLAASGGFATAAACKRVVAAPSSSVGSIGVYRLHVDVSGANAQEGVVYTFVFAGEHKVDGNPFEALPDAVRVDMQASVDQRYDEFVADIVESRGLSDEEVRATEARVYRANDALALGLIDAVNTPQNAVSAFVAELADDEPTEEEDDNMALPKNDAELAALIDAAKAEGASAVKPVDTDQVAKDAVAADRARRTAILALDEAKDKQTLAGTMADQDMTVETAKILLASAASEKAAEPAPQTAPVITAMNALGGAGVKTEENGNSGEPAMVELADGRKVSAVSAGLINSISPSRRLVAVK